MGKTYLDIVKYMVEGTFNIEGLVDKPDLIGAVFGQTEGLLGDDLDLRELQKNGKIGRIEIELSQSGNKTYGKLFLPASLDRVETCILAAAVESVDRVGPYEAQFKITKVEDTRAEKRRKLLERAKELVKRLLATEIPDSKELAEMVQSEVKISEVVNYGPENLPAGPDIAKSSEVIIVEGRADVLNLLRNDITNAIAIGGATNNIPKSIINLCNEKEVTLFVDGDRGGDMIIRSLIKFAEIDFVVKAPDGKEVEELTRKEIIKALRTKVPIEQYLEINKIKMQQNQSQQQKYYSKEQYQGNQAVQGGQSNQNNQGNYNGSQAEHGLDTVERRQQEVTQAKKPDENAYADSEASEQVSDVDIDNEDAQIEQVGYSSSAQQEAPQKQEKPVLQAIVLSQLAKGLDELSNTLNARLYNSAGDIIYGKDIPIRELIPAMQDTNNIYAVVLNGIITQRLIELALQKGVKALYGIRANPMPKKHPELIIYTKEQGRIE
ncbi:MAG: DNA primase DnaG [Candidatus Micrarchaeia archaeon]